MNVALLTGLDRRRGALRRSLGRPVALGLVGALVGTILAAGVLHAASVTISIKNYAFSPSPITIAAGTTVTWVNRDPAEHQVVSDTGAFPTSKLLKSGQSYSVKLTKVGTFNYHDGLNNFMKGTIIVTAAPKATPKPTPKPTAKPRATPRPTAKPTAKPTATPAAAAVPSAGASAGASAEASGTAGGRASESPGASAAGGGASGGSGADGSGGSSSGLVGVVQGLGLVLLAFLAGIGFQAFRRRRSGLLPGGPGSGPLSTPHSPMSPPAAAAPPSVPAAAAPLAGSTPAAPAGTRRGGSRSTARPMTYPAALDEDAPLESVREAPPPEDE